MKKKIIKRRKQPAVITILNFLISKLQLRSAEANENLEMAKLGFQKTKRIKHWMDVWRIEEGRIRAYQDAIALIESIKHKKL